jgi:hypothetical protein
MPGSKCRQLRQRQQFEQRSMGRAKVEAQASRASQPVTARISASYSGSGKSGTIDGAGDGAEPVCKRKPHVGQPAPAQNQRQLLRQQQQAQRALSRQQVMGVTSQPQKQQQAQVNANSGGSCNRCNAPALQRRCRCSHDPSRKSGQPTDRPENAAPAAVQQRQVRPQPQPQAQKQPKAASPPSAPAGKGREEEVLGAIDK